ncbi:MAG TPA: ABC transporter ATP-binding protein [Thermopetrobacter sp.]|nr:ABC transporter ATP-binding protein [Thermopetrobacter sp.]
MTALLRTIGLRKAFGGLQVTAGVDLDLRDGEIHALIGPNGAGKTTLINQLAGEIAPDGGRIEFLGRDITRRPAHARARLGLARSFQRTSLLPAMTVMDNALAAALANHGRPWGVFRAARRDAVLRAAAQAALELTGLADAAARPVAQLAHGQRKQLDLALALIGQPKVLLLDEPTAGLSPAEGREMVALLENLKGRWPMLLVEHDMDAVFALADTLSVLVAGRIVATGAPQDVRADARAQAAYFGDEINA